MTRRSAASLAAVSMLSVLLLAALLVPTFRNALVAEGFGIQSYLRSLAADMNLPWADHVGSPVFVTATVGDGHNDIHWSPVPSATGYVVYRASVGSERYRPVGYTKTLDVQDRVSVREVGVYQYAVTAVSGMSQSALSYSADASTVRIATRVDATRDHTIRAATGEVALFVPAGTFSEDCTVTISEIAVDGSGPDETASFMTSAYDFGPEGSAFGGAQPRLTLSYALTDDRDGFELDWVSKTARIYYLPNAGDRWSDVTQALSVDVAVNTVSGDLEHFSTYASGYTVMPHGRFTKDSTLCGACHDLHGAVCGELGTRADLNLCLYCHGAKLSTSPPAGAHGANVQAEFLLSDDQSAGQDDSRHPAYNQDMRCTDCHTPHRDPERYPKLLFAWQSDGSQQFVDDDSGVLGNAFCFGCHGTFENANMKSGYYAASGGDHETLYSGPHATYDYEPPATSDASCSIAPANGSGVQCLACHERHGADGAQYLGAFELGTSAEKQALCYSCHLASGTAATWNGRFIPQEFARASKHDITGATGAKLTCANCHNSHNVAAGDGDEWDLSRAADPDDITAGISDPVAFCLRCHDGGTPPTKTLTAAVVVPYTVQFPNWSSKPFFTGFSKSAFSSSGHGDSVAANDKLAGCDNCHDPHGSDNARLTAFSGGHFTQGHRTNTTAFAEEKLCYGCHNFGGTNCYVSGCHQYMPNIAPQMVKTSAHPTNTYSGKHSSTETASQLGGGNRHAECVDCHDAHLAKRGTHTMGSNLASNSILGSKGVSPNGRSAWGTPSNYTVKTITYEYELCYKCHSSYTTGYTGQDKAKEFNPANFSTHPVEGVGANLGVKDGSFTQGTPWNPTAGDDADYTAGSPKMTCTDCHASETEADPRGPHGSTIAHVLRGTASTTMVGDGSESTLCFVCHAYSVYAYTSASGSVSGGPGIRGIEDANSRVNHRHFYDRGATCMDCHVPHGQNEYHLMRLQFTHSTAGSYGGGTLTRTGICSSCHGNSSTVSYTNSY
jgi:predicted CXXCH cytochrome family protein